MANEVRLIKITEEQLLAIKAMAYGCVNNKRLVGASYMTGLSTDSHQSIPFDKAWGIVQGFVEEIPTIDPESLRPKGRWRLNKDGSGTCSECHRTRNDVWDMDNWDNFCSHCGAKMEG